MSVSTPQCWDGMCHQHWCDGLQECVSTHELPRNVTRKPRLGLVTIPSSDTKLGPGTQKIKGQYGTPTNAQQRTSHAKASRVPLQAGDTVLQCLSESFPKNSSKGEQRGCEASSTPTSQSCAEKEHFLKRNERPFPVSLWSCCSVLISGWKGLDVGDVLLPTLMASHASNHCHTTTLHGYSPFTDGVPYSSSLW